MSLSKHIKEHEILGIPDSDEVEASYKRLDGDNTFLDQGVVVQADDAATELVARFEAVTCRPYFRIVEVLAPLQGNPIGLLLSLTYANDQ